MLRPNSLLRELGRRAAHGIREILDERAAARRTRFVQHDVVHAAVPDLHELHVLTADIEDAVHIRLEILRRVEMRDGLHFALVERERILQELFPVTGRAGVGDACARVHARKHIQKRIPADTEGLALVISIPGIKQIAVRGDQNDLHRSRTRVDTQEAVPLIRREVALLHLILRLALQECPVGFLVRKQRLEQVQLGGQRAGALQRLEDLGKLMILALSSLHGSAARGEQMRLLREDSGLLRQAQRAHERLLQFGQEIQRAAQKYDFSGDPASAGEARDGLVHDRLENAGREVFSGHAVIDQRLDIALRKHAASRGDRIDLLISLRILVQTGCVRLQQRRHLVNERARAAGTDAVHALLHLFQEDDLRILAAKLDHAVRLSDLFFHGGSDSHDFLDKIRLQDLRKA